MNQEGPIFTCTVCDHDIGIEETENYYHEL